MRPPEPVPIIAKLLWLALEHAVSDFAMKHDGMKKKMKSIKEGMRNLVRAICIANTRSGVKLLYDRSRIVWERPLRRKEAQVAFVRGGESTLARVGQGMWNKVESASTHGRTSARARRDRQDFHSTIH